MKGLRLYKKEKLCSPTAIDALFARSGGASAALSYPLTVSYTHLTLPTNSRV